MTGSPHIVVRASAGTGKTYRLTVEIIRLLAAGAQPGTILATTFTRKAAGQILGRTFDLLGRAAADDEALAGLRRLAPQLTREGCVTLSARIAAGLHRLNILTIDAFFARLASGFALECGLAPGWRIMSEEDLERAISEAVTEALSQPILGSDGSDRRLSLAMALHMGGAGRSVHADALNAVTGAQAALGEPVDESVWAAIGPDRPPLAASEVRELISRLVAAPLPLTKKGEPNKKWASAVAQAGGIAATGAWEKFIETGLSARVAEGGADFCGCSIPDGIRGLLAALNAHAAAVELGRLRDRNTATGILLDRFDAALQRRKQAEGRYFFDDLPRMLLDSDATGRLLDMYYRLDASIRHLLLDEFQDTSLTQFRLLRPIMDELAASEDGSVFCVGDPKQSLYSWRGGRAELLLRLRDRWPQFQDQSLDVNRRSSPVILSVVNTVFSGLAGNLALAEQREAAAAWSDRFPLHKAHHQSLSGVVRMWDAPMAGVDGDGRPAPVETLRLAAQRVQALAAEHPGFTIGVLVRRNQPIPRLLQELDRLGLRASKEGGVPLLASPASAAAAALLHLADHPGDSAALFLVASGPLGKVVGLTDPMDGLRARKVASRLRRELVEAGYAAVFTRWLAALAPDLDAHAFERFERLIDLAHEFDDAGAGLRPSALARVIRDRAIDDPSADRIRVMTVHRAKGLEFDAVVLPDLGFAPSLRNTILVDRRREDGTPDSLGRIVAATWSGSAPLRGLSEPLSELYERATRAQTEEELCGLYVAMTRARRVLEIILPSKPRGRSCPAEILRNALPGKPSGGPPGLLFEDGETPADAPAGVPPAVPSGSVTVLLTPARPPPHRWASRSPSSLKRVQPIGEIFAPPSTAMDRGTVLHAWFEQIEWLDAGEPTDQELPGLPDSGAPAGLDPVEILRAFRRAVAPGSRVGRLLRRAEYRSRAADEVRLKREWAFAVPRPHSATLLSGRFDRVVIGMRAGRPAWAEVIDFKTDAIAPGAQATHAAAQVHRRQMHAYRDAAASLLALDKRSVTVVVAFTDTSRIIRFRSRR